jgi:leader peptidase (prepilin peptidase)/N-methyltransferase
VIGACIFSFLNVVICRVPQQMDFVRGRSHCTHCGHAFGAGDLIPVFSFLWLRGRCRYCGGRIPVRDTLVELLGGLVGVWCVSRYGWSAQAFLLFLFAAVLTAVAAVDADTMEIPDGFSLAALVLGGCACFVFPEIPLWQHLAGIPSASLILWLITLLVPNAFGGGDIKLMAACGLFLGIRLCLLALFLAILTGGIWGIYLLVSRRAGRGDCFAFGPFLCLGMAAAWTVGEPLLQWYLSLLA